MRQLNEGCGTLASNIALLADSAPLIPLWRLPIAVIPVIGVLLILHQWSLPVRTSLLAMGRMFVQLLLLGYVLTWVFDESAPWNHQLAIVLIVLPLMLMAASWISLRVLSDRRSALFWKVVGAELRAAWLILRDRAVRWTIGYGFAPARALWVLGGLVGVAWLLAWLAWDEGSFAPNSAPVLVSPGWALVQGEANPAEAWSEDTALGGDWESFSAFAYGVDVVVPLIEFGQTQAWAPSTERGDWGRVLWWARWLRTVLGWIVSALGIAAVTGIVQRGQPE